MRTPAAAVAHLEKLGFAADEWVTLSPGAIVVTTRGVETPDGGFINLGRMVVICPEGES